MVKKVLKDTKKLVGLNLGVGIGTGIIAGAGGSTAGIGAVAGFTPIIGTTVMGGHALRLAGKLKPKKSKKIKYGGY